MTFILHAIKSCTRLRPLCPPLIAATFIAAYWPTLLSLHQRWSRLDETYAHGYILLTLSLWLYWESRPASASTPSAKVTPFRLACLSALALASVAWSVGALAGIAVAQQILLPPIALLCIAALSDRTTLTRALVPCGLLILAIPIWEELLTAHLQAWSTLVPAWLVRQLFGLPVEIGGFEVHVPAGTFIIRGGCSGLGFLLTATTLGVTFGQLFLRQRWSRVICVAIAAALGILTNWIRITSLILIGQYTNMTSSLVNEGHLMFGFYIFAGISLCTILIATRLLPANAAAVPARATTIESVSTETPHQLPASFGVATLMALTVGPLLTAMLWIKHEHAVASTAPQHLGKLFTLSNQAKTDSGFQHATIDAIYLNQNDPTLQVHVAYYANAFGRGKLISDNNSMLPAGWHMLEQTIKQPPLLPTTTITVASDPNQQKFMLWSWYIIGNDFASGSKQIRMTQLKNALQLQTEGMFVALSAPCILPGCAYTDTQLAQHAPLILDTLLHWQVTTLAGSD